MARMVPFTEFGEPSASFARDAYRMAMHAPSVLCKETASEHVIKAHLPGPSREDVLVHQEDGRTLTISRKRKREDVHETDTWHLHVHLPEDTDLDGITTKMDNGVLTMVVPKVEKQKPGARRIHMVPSMVFGEPSASIANRMANMSVDWMETDSEHVIKADLPGLSREDVLVHKEYGHTLTISGNPKREEVYKTDTWHHHVHCFNLPEDTDLDGITAKMDNGVLTIVVPKVEKKKPGPRRIQISGEVAPAVEESKVNDDAAPAQLPQQ